MGLREGTIGAEVWWGQNMGAFMLGRDENQFMVLRYGEGDGLPTDPYNSYVSGLPMREGVTYMEVDSWVYAVDMNAYRDHYGRDPIHAGISVSGCETHWVLSGDARSRTYPDAKVSDIGFWHFLMARILPLVEIQEDEKLTFGLGSNYLPKSILYPRNDYYRLVADISPQVVYEQGWEYGKGALQLGLLKTLAQMGIDLR